MLAAVIPTPIPLHAGSPSHFILSMGDSGLTVPIAALLAVAMLTGKRLRRSGLVFSSLFVCVTSIVFATKLGLFGWGDGIDSISFRGPSGHATLAACVWPVVAWLLASRAVRAVQDAAVAVGFAIALAVAYVLVAYGYHTLPETVAGTLLGSSASWRVLRSTRADPSPPVCRVMLATLVIAAWFGFQHGRPLVPMESFKYAVHAFVEKTRAPS